MQVNRNSTQESTVGLLRRGPYGSPVPTPTMKQVFQFPLSLGEIHLQFIQSLHKDRRSIMGRPTSFDLFNLAFDILNSLFDL